MPTLHFATALTEAGWQNDLAVDFTDGTITAITPSHSGDGAERIAGIAVPGMPNVHSHAFQRGMAGLTQRRGPSGDNFWTWREVMYRFLAALTPDDVEALAAMAYAEMLEGGYTAAGEFHYLHNDIDGRPYANPAEMAERVTAAAEATGIGMTLLPCFYAHGGAGGKPPLPGQRRFVSDLDGFARLMEGGLRALAPLPDANCGIAPHSLRAATAEEIRALIAAWPGRPVHSHAAEQTKEVEEVLAATGRRPVEGLLEMGADSRWCLIHSTHMTGAETLGLARSGAVAGLCPLTESDLGDGVFPADACLAAGGHIGIGSDSNIVLSAAEELRTLEFSQRLRDRRRNVLAQQEGDSIGRALFDWARLGGARALGRRIGRLAVGCRADIVVLDATHPAVPAADDRALDGWIFGGGRGAVSRVFVGGREVVRDGRHNGRAAIAARYRATLDRLLA